MASSSPPTAAMRPTTVTPSELLEHDDSLQKRMSVEKGIVDELLLVCGVIGSSNELGEFIPVTDCLNWLQDLQRALRRDDDLYRPISLLLGNWKVVQQKLLPLVLTCRYDNAMVLTVVKILVILTKPLSETTKRAGRMVIDIKSRKVPDDVIVEQIKLRENALEQGQMLMEYKRAFTHHKSHSSEKGLISIFVSLLAEPLSKTGTSRSDADHLTIELVLHLFRNLLSAEPILKGSPETSQKSAQLHHELICLFEKELVLEIVLVIAQDMESRENAQYNLLLMELLNHLLRGQDPTAVARATLATRPKAPPLAYHVNDKSQSHKAAQKPKPGSLRAQLHRERKKLLPPMTTRHSHFGGTLVVSRLDGGKRQYMSAALVEKGTSKPSAQKRKNRKTDPFIGSGRTSAAHSRIVMDEPSSPAASRAQKTLHTFCDRFVKDCYGPLMKSLKNEFRRDSVRLEEGDKVVLFRMIWFFSQWWRVDGRKSHESSNALGQLIFTMDVFTFNLVLNAIDSFQQHRKYSQLAQSVSLYSEMMQLLHFMYHSKDSTENIMALGLMDRLFYGSDPLDRLPKLLSKWTPGSLAREFVCDLVELTHVTLKLLETNTKETPATDSNNKERIDAVVRMKQAAADFDVTSYTVRKIISNQVVSMYTHLLAHYAKNAPHVNHHIVAFFLRISRVQVAMNSTDNIEGVPSNPFELKPTTLEPMLYNIQLFIVLDQILNDITIRNEKEYAAVVAFATSLMSRFAHHAQSNQMAFVECLFRHPVPHRFCELTTNLYVSEELRMIGERELLLEEHRRLAGEGAEDDYDDFGQEQHRRPSTRNTARQPVATTAGPEDDDEEVEWDDGDKKEPAAPTSSPRPDCSEPEKREDDAEANDDEDDEQWSDRRKFVPKRKFLSDVNATVTSPSRDSIVDKRPKILRSVLDDESSDEDVFEANDSAPPAAPSSSPKPNVSAPEKDEDDPKANDAENDDEQWSDRRTFVPKRKLLSDVDANVTSPSHESSVDKRRKILKPVLDDDSSYEDDDEVYDSAPAAAASGTKRSRLAIEENDEDDD